jgi:hypothetical protein
MDLWIQELPSVDAGADALICETGYTLLDATESNTSSVLWTSAGGGTFTPGGATSTALNPAYIPSASEVAGGSATLTLTGQPINPCSLIDFDQVTLTIQPLPIANAGPDATGCETGYTFSGVSVQFNSNLEWTSNGTGSFSPNAITLLATYIPSADDIDNGLVTLTLVANPLSPCVLSDEDDMDLTIIENPTVNAGSDATICANGNYALIGATATDYSSLAWAGGTGTFTPSANVLNPTYTPGIGESGLITLCLTAQPNSPCAIPAFECIDLNIVPLPTANAGSDGVLCQTGGVITGVASNNTSTMWTTAGDGTFDDATALSTTYYP